MPTVATPEYDVVSGTVAGIATFNADVDAAVANGFAPIGTPVTDGVDIHQVMFRGAVASFIAEYPITGITGFATSGFQTLTVSPARTGANVPGIGADIYDFDISIDGAGTQQESITTAGGEDYDAIAALMDAEVAPAASVVFDDALSAFVVTSTTSGSSSTIDVFAGTAGNTGGDLFSAIETADTVTITFDTPVDGVDASTTKNFTIAGDHADDFNAGYKFTVTRSTGNDGVYSVRDGGSSFAAGTTTIPVNETPPSPVADGFIEAHSPSVGP